MKRPLHAAAGRGHAEVVKLLLDKSAMISKVIALDSPFVTLNYHKVSEKMYISISNVII